MCSGLLMQETPPPTGGALSQCCKDPPHTDPQVSSPDARLALARQARWL